MTALVAALQGRAPTLTLPRVNAVQVRHLAAVGLLIAGVVVLVGWGWGLLVGAVALEATR